MTDLQKSPSWESRKYRIGRRTENGFPFSEGFPRHYRGVTYTLITNDGQEHKGSRVDDSLQYRSEGLQWKNANGNSISGHVVICWCEEEK